MRSREARIAQIVQQMGGVSFHARVCSLYTCREIGVGAVIGGWDKGVMEMSLGQEVCTIISPYCPRLAHLLLRLVQGRLVCHHTHAYGEDGDPNPPAIPPFATLVFDVKLLNIHRG